jgi:hypothetical protein
MAWKNNDEKRREQRKKIILEKGLELWSSDAPLPLRYKWYRSTRHKIRFLKHFYFRSNSKYYLRYSQIARGDSRSCLGPLGEIETRSSKHPSRFEMGWDHPTSKTAKISLEIAGWDQVNTRVRYVYWWMYLGKYSGHTTHTYVDQCTYPISNFLRTRASRSRCHLDSRFLGSCLGVLDRQSPLPISARELGSGPRFGTLPGKLLTAIFGLGLCFYLQCPALNNTRKSGAAAIRSQEQYFSLPNTVS